MTWADNFYAESFRHSVFTVLLRNARQKRPTLTVPQNVNNDINLHAVSKLTSLLASTVRVTMTARL